jgi:hypothetical protein
MTNTEHTQLIQFATNLADVCYAIEREFGFDRERSTPARLALSVMNGRADERIASDPRVVAAHGAAIRSVW